MSPEYESLFRQEVEFRIIEERSPLVEAFIIENGLSPAKVVKCEPQSWCERKRCFVNVEEQVHFRQRLAGYEEKADHLTSQPVQSVM